MMSSLLFVLSLLCYKLSISFKVKHPMNIQENVRFGLLKSKTQSKLRPNCDWVIASNDLQALEPIGICWVLSGLSWRADYDKYTDQATYKQWDNEQCSGDFNIYGQDTVIEANVNTGFLCESYALTQPFVVTWFDGRGTTQFLPSQSSATGIPNNCKRDFGDIFFQVLPCDDTTSSITWAFYQDDKCEILIPPNSYFPYFFNTPQQSRCIKFNHTSTFSVGDINFMEEASEIGYAEYTVDDIVCTKRRPYPCDGKKIN